MDGHAPSGMVALIHPAKDLAMPRHLSSLFSIVLAVGGIPALAHADETWTNPAGTLVYQEDLRDIAILSFPIAATPFAQAGGASDAAVYLPGLGGNYDNRSVHDGYWVMPGQAMCSAAITAPDGLASQAWGRAQIVFDRAAFPTGFTLLLGACFDTPSIPVRADLP